MQVTGFHSLRRSRHEFSRDLRFGVRNGLLLGVVLTAVASVAQLARNGRIDRFGVGLLVACTIYCLGGVLAGAIYGALRPWTASLLGRGTVGFFVMLPVAAMIVTLAIPASERSFGILPLTLMLAVIMGPVYAIALLRK